MRSTNRGVLVPIVAEGCQESYLSAGDELLLGFYTLVIVSCFVTNFVVFVFIAFSPSLRSLTNLVFASMSSVCIISSALCSPLELYRVYWGYEHWQTPHFFCKLYWMLEPATTFSFAMHVALFAIYRLKSLLNPYKVVQLSRASMIVMLSCIWATSLGIASPVCVYSSVRDPSEHKCSYASCSIKNENGKDHKYVLLAYACVFSICYILIFIVSSIFISYTCKNKSRRRDGLASEEARKEAAMATVHAVRKDATLNRGVELADYEATVANHHQLGALYFENRQQRDIFKQFLSVISAFMLGHTPILLFSIGLVHAGGYMSLKVVNLFTRCGEILFALIVVATTPKLRARLRHLTPFRRHGTGTSSTRR